MMNNGEPTYSVKTDLLIFIYDELDEILWRDVRVVTQDSHR